MIFRIAPFSVRNKFIDKVSGSTLIRKAASALALSLSLSQLSVGAGVGVGFSQQAIAQEPTQPTEQPTSSKAIATQQIADLLPADTPLAMFFTADEADWDALQQFELFSKLSVFTDSLFTGIAAGAGGPQTSIFGGTGDRWYGEQFAIVALPDTSPRSIAVTDVEKEILFVTTTINEAAVEQYKTYLETHRDNPPEKSTFLDAELWVWPTEEISYGSWEEDYSEFPSVPHEDWPADQFSKAQPAKTQNEVRLKARLDKDPNAMPTPEDFEAQADDGTYNKQGQAIAFVDGYLLSAVEPEALKKLLRYREFNYARLSENPLFTRSGYSEESGALFRLYSDLAEISKYNIDGSEFSSSMPAYPGIPDIPGLPNNLPGFPIAPDSIITRQELQGQIISALKGITVDGLIYPQNEGIRFQGRVYGNNLLRSNPTPELDYADSALEFVPAATYSLSSGRDIAGIWRQFARSLSTSPATREYLQQARDFVQTTTGLDLDDELLGWMDREFVLFFFPSNEGALNSFSPGLGVEIGVAIQTSDRTTAQNTLDTIDGLLSFFAQPTTVNGIPVVSWQAPSFGGGPDTPAFTSYLSHGWVSDDTLIITSGTGAMSKVLNPTAFSPLSEEPTFLNATRPLPDPNNGYGYFNAGSSFSLIFSLVSEWLEIPANDPFLQTVRSYLGTIRGAGSTTSSTAEYWQLDSLLNLAPAESTTVEEPTQVESEDN